VSSLLLALVLVPACTTTQPKGESASPDGPRILFLHLKVTDSSATLLDSSVEPGSVKQRRVQESPLHIQFDVTSPTGQRLWSGDVEDPQVRHLEYEDPDHPGQIRSRVVRTGEGEVMIRFPLVENGSVVEFYRLVPTASGTARTRFGRIELNIPGDS
jgi:hypothetical protein